MTDVTRSMLRHLAEQTIKSAKQGDTYEALLLIQEQIELIATDGGRLVDAKLYSPGSR